MVAVKETGPRLSAALSTGMVGNLSIGSTAGPAIMMSWCPGPAPFVPGRSATIHQRRPSIVPVAISPGCAPRPGAWTVTVGGRPGEAGAGPAVRCTTDGTPNATAVAAATTPIARA